MSARVSTLLNVGPGGGRYAFLLVEWNDYANDVRGELNRQAQAFGLDLGPNGVLVQPGPQRMFEITQEILTKPWPDDIKERFDVDQEPILLVLDCDWNTFDPRTDPYALIWLSGFRSESAAVSPLLHDLARRTRRGQDIVAYLRDVAARQRREAATDTAAHGAGMLARLASYIEIKPRVFGVSIDLKALLRDMASS